MNGIEALWSMPFAWPVAWALAHFLWQGALAGLLLAGVLALVDKRNASLRYALAAGTMLVLLALPVLTALWLAPSAGDSVLETVPAASSVPAGTATPSEAGMAGAGAAGLAPAFQLQPALPWLLAFWLSGVAALSFYHLGGWLQARRLERRGTRPVPELWEEALAGLRRRLGIARAVRMLESAMVPVPAVVGWLRPVILVPASALSGLTPQQLEAILAHELAHVRRNDYLVNLLQTVVETLLFYHPAVWWVSRLVRQEREHCCDDLAVAVCGDPLVYARALADLEGLRAPSPRLAMASDGGSLLARIRRLAGVPSRSSRRSWLTAVLALAVLGTGAALLSARPAPAPTGETEEAAVEVEEPARAASAAPAPAPAPQTARPAPAAAERDLRGGNQQGVWMAERKENGRIWLQMKLRETDDEDHWNFSSTFPESAFTGLSGNAERFELRRDAGTVTFEGRFDGAGPGSQGTGTFRFQADPGYIRDMASLGYQVQAKVFELALFDISRGYVREIRSLGYTDLSLQKLIEFGIFHVTPEFIREMAQLGFENIPAQRLIEIRIHRVTPETVREWRSAGYNDLTLQKMVELGIHKVTPEYLRELSGLGFKDMSLSQALSFRIHRVTPEFIREMANYGYNDLSAEDLVNFRIHRVTPDFLRELRELGYENVPADDLTAMRIHRVTPEFIRAARQEKGRDLTVGELVDLRIHGYAKRGGRDE
ncbi:MAG TPA: M56 family metallopeptidase [Thermoanaerobaculia bacterium]